MFVKQFFVICLLAATSVKAENVVFKLDSAKKLGAGNSLTVTSCTATDIVFQSQIVGVTDTIWGISHPGCNFATAQNILFKNSMLAYLPQMIFWAFPNMLKLDLTGTSLQELRPNTFQGANKLTEILIPQVTKGLTANAFSGALALQRLVVQCPYGYDATVDPNAFRGLKALTDLSATGFQISAIQSTTLIDSPNLSFLFINKVSAIDRTALSTLKGLFMLFLMGITSTTVDKDLLLNNTQLGHISMGYNMISTIDPGFFKTNVELEWINLSSNKFTTLPATLFANQPNLKGLELQLNQLSSIPATLFQKNVKIEGLHLRDNLLAALDKATFSTLINLKYLYLSNNRLAALDSATFSNNLKLDTVDLAGNLLVTLAKTQFTPNTLLLNILLQNNKLNAIYNTTFSGLTKLSGLNLLNNTCINQNFNPVNAATVASALAKCDANANANAVPAPNCDKYVTAIKSLVATINSTITVLGNLAQALTQIANMPA
jgi:Leucine-rich repeat (LRR) protein